jgi:acyl-CoA synthetase (AMP-forming)/AMP-acid ligase II
LVEASVIAHCRDLLAHYKCPTSVEAMDALPRNPSGKILKRELRDTHFGAGDSDDSRPGSGTPVSPVSE